MVICYVSLKQHSKNAGVKFIKTINELTEVIECYSISGEFDFMLKVVCEDMNAYYDFHVNKLKRGRQYRACAEHFCHGHHQANTPVDS